MELDLANAQELVYVLEDAQDVGLTFVAFEWHTDLSELNPRHIYFFDKAGYALDYARSANARREPAGPGLAYPVQCMTIENMLSELAKVNPLTINNETMNYNNLENRKEDMQRLGASKASVEQMEKKMESGVADFTVSEKLNGTKGHIDAELFFKKSGQSENYYLNKFTVTLNTAKPLEAGQKYYVVSPNPADATKNLHRGFENVYEAISFFREQTGDSKLGTGKLPSNINDLARMEKGKVNYVEKDFQRIFRVPPVSQTIFTEQGRGFTLEQAANLIEGRAVYRDDLMTFNGDPYKAWVKLNMDAPKDKYQNHTTTQYHVPTYGFDLKSSLEKYQIKELDEPKKMEKLMSEMENGNRPWVTTTKDGEDVKLRIEAVPRYSQINFYHDNGKPEKREQFLKEPTLENNLQLNKEKGQNKQQEQGMAV